MAAGASHFARTEARVGFLAASKNSGQQRRRLLRVALRLRCRIGNASPCASSPAPSMGGQVDCWFCHFDAIGPMTSARIAPCPHHSPWRLAAPHRVVGPEPARGEGQGRGNSGVFFGPYELQVLDSYENDTYFDGQAGAIYKQQPPMVNAMRKPGEWNTYDILWTAPRFKRRQARVAGVHHRAAQRRGDAQPLSAPRRHAIQPPAEVQRPRRLPINLQDHGNPVRFRNIWVRP